ncbi:MAG: hypothetical protein PUF62_11335 [Bacteroidales bacterium]|nr:hypothetical protein [Bacteroidales bacterium]
MARITPIDSIRGISGKYGSRSNEYFTINSSSNRIHLEKYLNKSASSATELQLAQMKDFATQQKMVQIFCSPSPGNSVFGVHSDCCLFYHSSNLR